MSQEPTQFNSTTACLQLNPKPKSLNSKPYILRRAASEGGQATERHVDRRGAVAGFATLLLLFWLLKGSRNEDLSFSGFRV